MKSLIRFRIALLLLLGYSFLFTSVVTAAPAAENNHKFPQPKVSVQSFSDSVQDLVLQTKSRLKNLNLNLKNLNLNLLDDDTRNKLKELISTNNAFVAARSHYENKTNNNTKKKIVIVSDGSMEGLAAALLLSSQQEKEHSSNLQVILLTPSSSLERRKSQTSCLNNKDDDDFLLLTSLGGLEWLFQDHLPSSIVQRYLDTFVTGNEHLVALPIEPHPVIPATFQNKIMVEDEDENDNKSDTKRSSPLEFTPQVSSLLTSSSGSSNSMIGRGMSRHVLERFLWKELVKLSKQNKIQIQTYTSIETIQMNEKNESNKHLIRLTGTDDDQGGSNNGGKEFTIQDISLLIGADGANSQVRTLATRRRLKSNIWTKLFLLPLICNNKKKELKYQTQTSNWSRRRIVTLPMTASDVRAHLPPDAYLPRHEFYTFHSIHASHKRTGLCLLVPPEGNVQLIAHQKHDFWRSKRLQSSTQIHISLCQLFPQLSFGLFSPQVVQTIQEAQQTHSNKKLMKYDKHVHSNVLVTSPHSGLVLLGSAARSLAGDFDCSALNVALSELIELKRLLLLDDTNIGTALKQFQPTWQRSTVALLRTSQLTSAPMHYGIPTQSFGESISKTIYHFNSVLKRSLHNMMGTPLEWRHSKYQQQQQQQQQHEQRASLLVDGLSKVDLFSRVLWFLFLSFVILV